MTKNLSSWGRRGVCPCASWPYPLRELLNALQQTFQKRRHLPAALQHHKPSARVHSHACSRVPGGPPSPRSKLISTHFPATADLSLGDQSAPVSDLSGASSNHLRWSTPPRGSSVRLRLHSFSSLRVYTTQPMSDPLKVHAVPHPNAYLASRSRPGCAFWFTHFAILSWRKERKSCNPPAATWCLPLTPPSPFFGCFVLFFFFFLFGQYSFPTAASCRLQADAAGCGGRGPGRREGVAWAG